MAASVGIALQPRIEREVAREPAEGPPGGARGGPHARAGDPGDRDAGARQRAGEGLVLERGVGLQAADAAVGVGGDRDRRAAEVRVGGPGQGAQPRRQADGPAPREAVVEAVDHHLAANRLRSVRGRLQERRQPAGLDLGVGVRGGHEAVGRSRGEQPFARDVHAQPSRGAHAERWALDDMQAQVARGLQSVLARGIGAAVQDEDDLVGIARHAALSRQRGDAGADEGLLVPRRHRDDRSQRGHAPRSSRRRAAS